MRYQHLSNYQKINVWYFSIFPSVPWTYRIPVGRSGLIWGAGAENPANNAHVWAWMAYRKSTCCAF